MAITKSKQIEILQQSKEMHIELIESNISVVRKSFSLMNVPQSGDAYTECLNMYEMKDSTILKLEQEKIEITRYFNFLIDKCINS